MHKFNPKDEPATVQIEVNPRRYATIALIDAKGKVLRKADGKDESYLIRVEGQTPGEESRMWVPPRIAEDLTVQSGVDAGRGIPPIARILRSRTADEAVGKTKPEAPARKKE